MTQQRYALFHTTHHVYMGSQLFDHVPTLADFGTEEGIIHKVSLDFEGEPCVLDVKTKKIKPMNHEEYNELLRLIDKTPEEHLNKYIYNAYSLAQNLYVEYYNDSKSVSVLVIPLRGTDYNLIKEKIQSANLYGNAEYLFSTSVGLEIISLSKEQWLKIGKEADEISTANYIKYAFLQNALKDGAMLESLDINFPKIKTIKV
jgi:hypothetical protein